jgi:hypothetical protein
LVLYGLTVAAGYDLPAFISFGKLVMNRTISDENIKAGQSTEAKPYVTAMIIILISHLAFVFQKG